MNYYNKKENRIQSTPFPGALLFPDKFMDVYYMKGKRSAGFVTVIDDGVTVTSCEWNEEEYKKWCDENPEIDSLKEEKEYRISKSKTDLELYLNENPMQWTDRQYYSITQEKQNQLMGKLMAATMAKAAGKPYELTWNSTGEVCKEWTLDDLSALAFAIDSRVTSLVTYQQTQEVAMRNSTTQDDLDAIVVDYDTVPVQPLQEVNP